MNPVHPDSREVVLPRLQQILMKVQQMQLQAAAENALLVRLVCQVTKANAASVGKRVPKVGLT